MSSSNQCNSSHSQKLKKATIQLGIWTLAWLMSLALATFGPIYIWESGKVINSVFIVVNLLIGIGVIIANKKHIEQLDELQQRITLNAMAITLGVGLIGGLSYSLLDVTNVVAFDAEISHLVTLMGLTYGLATVIGHRNYS